MGIITSFQEVFLHKLTQVTCGRSFPFQAAAGVAVNILRLGFHRYYIFLFSKLPLAISCNLIDSSSKFVFLYFKEKKTQQFGWLDKAGDRLPLVFALQSEAEGSLLLPQDHYFNNSDFNS